MECPYCGGSGTVRNGLDSHGKQRFLCHSCSRRFTEGGVRETRRKIRVEEPESDPIRGSVNRDVEAGLRSELRATKRERAFQDLLLEAIRGAAPAFAAPPPLPEVPVSSQKTTTRLVLGMADHHTNRVVDPRAIEGFNAYNFDIYARRLWSIVRGVISIARHNFTYGNRIDQLSINYLGDIGNDSHREENLRTNQMAENVASLVAAHINAQAIDCLLRAKDDAGNALFPRIAVRGVVGNEPRMDKKFNWQEPWRSWDWMIYQWIAASLGDGGGRIEYVIPWSMKYRVEDLGWRFLLDHGHEIRGWAGIPFYGISRSNAQEQHLRRDDGGFEYRMTGHLHTQAQLPTFCRAHYVCPSLVGPDGYAHNGLGVTGEIGQTLLAVTEARGVISSWNVYADENEAAPFIYDRDLAVGGAFKAMEAWRKAEC